MSPKTWVSSSIIVNLRWREWDGVAWFRRTARRRTISRHRQRSIVVTQNPILHRERYNFSFEMEINKIAVEDVKIDTDWKKKSHVIIWKCSVDRHSRWISPSENKSSEQNDFQTCETHKSCSFLSPNWSRSRHRFSWSRRSNGPSQLRERSSLTTDKSPKESLRQSRGTRLNPFACLFYFFTLCSRIIMFDIPWPKVFEMNFRWCSIYDPRQFDMTSPVICRNLCWDRIFLQSDNIFRKLITQCLSMMC